MPEFEKCISEKYKLKWYSRTDEPAIFFGVYHQPHIDAMVQQNALVVVVWIGTDSWVLRNRKDLNYRNLLNASHVRHIATSKWSVDDLSALGVSHLYIPINYVPTEKFQPVKLGSKVYCYSHPTRPILYGQKIIDEVKKRLPDIEFIETKDYYDNPLEEMPKLYSECFIGLRPTIHDGVSESVVELGLMGRRCIHNGHAPNAIHYRTVEDIVNSIKEEQDLVIEGIPIVHNQLAEKVAEYANVGDDWLYEEFYKGVKL